MLAVPTYNPRLSSGTVWRLTPAASGGLLSLVDRAPDLSVLVAALERSRPPAPLDGRHLPHLMTDPFRAAEDGGSAFRRSGGPGLFHAGETVETAAAAALSRRRRFWDDCPGLPLPERPARMTALAVPYITRRCLDLTLPPPGDQTAPDLTDPNQTCALAELARDMGADAIRYASRHRAGCFEVALLSCRAFAAPAPAASEEWWIGPGPHGLMAASADGGHAVET